MAVGNNFHTTHPDDLTETNRKKFTPDTHDQHFCKSAVPTLSLKRDYLAHHRKLNSQCLAAVTVPKTFNLSE